jgi:hypothetical protein
VAIRLYLGKNVLDRAIWADDERGPHDAHHFFPVHVFLLQHAESVGHFPVGVGQQGEGQVELLLEFLLRFGRVGRNPDDDRAGLLNLFVRVAEPARFYGSARSVSAGIEEEDHGFAAQILRRDFFSVLVLQSKVRSLIMDIHEISFSSELRP